MKNILKFILVFIGLLIILVGISFFSWDVPASGDKKIQENTSTGSDTLSGIQSRVAWKVQQILDDTEVLKTLENIEKDTPKYNKDGAIFMNRERLLPVQRDQNYYSEWTVRTPGESDRWARRIIEGKWGELYFTDDHYSSFTRIR